MACGILISMNIRKTFITAALILAAGLSWAINVDKAQLKGRTDRENPVSYKVGEKIKFSLTLTEADLSGGEYFIAWTRTGDDGVTQNGKSPIVSNGTMEIETTLSKPGFVRVEAYLVDSTGKRVLRKNNAPGAVTWGSEKGVFFDGGAGADISKIKQGDKEPDDFDAFWCKQKAALKKVPLKAKRWEVKSPREDVKVYAVEIDCAGPRPATGYYTVPVAASTGKKYPIRVTFDGYGTNIQRVPQHIWYTNEIWLNINAHGYSLEKDKKYYDEFFESIRSGGNGYAFDPVQNSDPEKAYFHGMALRVMRALEYMKTLPEWDKKNLIVAGGSQGGLQTMWAAALDKDVTEAQPEITWCCDIGKKGEGRLRSNSEPQYTDALRYFDAANHAKRVKCKVNCTRAGLGDYTCPPSGLAIVFNNLKAPVTYKWVQGSRHGFVPLNPNQEFVTVKTQSRVCD